MNTYTLQIGADVRVYGSVTIEAESIRDAVAKLQDSLPYNVPDFDINETTTDTITNVAVIQADLHTEGEIESCDFDEDLVNPGHELGWFTIPFSALAPIMALLDSAPRPLNWWATKLESICLQQLALSTAARMRSAD